MPFPETDCLPPEGGLGFGIWQVNRKILFLNPRNDGGQLFLPTAKPVSAPRMQRSEIRGKFITIFYKSAKHDRYLPSTIFNPRHILKIIFNFVLL